MSQVTGLIVMSTVEHGPTKHENFEGKRSVNEDQYKGGWFRRGGGSRTLKSRKGHVSKNLTASPII